jgi:hypothetical protein
MAVELNAAQLKRVAENALIPRLVEWQRGHVDRNVATHLANMVVEALYEAALIGREQGVEQGIIAGLRMIKSWNDQDDGE